MAKRSSSLALFVTLLVVLLDPFGSQVTCEKYKSASQVELKQELRTNSRQRRQLLCGEIGQRCCTVNVCDEPHSFCGWDGWNPNTWPICRRCGVQGSPCCPSDVHQGCDIWMTCKSFRCIPCGQEIGRSCCPDGQCRQGKCIRTLYGNICDIQLNNNIIEKKV